MFLTVVSSEGTIVFLLFILWNDLVLISNSLAFAQVHEDCSLYMPLLH